MDILTKNLDTTKKYILLYQAVDSKFKEQRIHLRDKTVETINKKATLMLMLNDDEDIGNPENLFNEICNLRLKFTELIVEERVGKEMIMKEYIKNIKKNSKNPCKVNKNSDMNTELIVEERVGKDMIMKDKNPCKVNKNSDMNTELIVEERVGKDMIMKDKNPCKVNKNSDMNTSKKKSRYDLSRYDCVQISNDLSTFIFNEGLFSRVDVTKHICNYIKKNNLQNPKDRRQIFPDKKLSLLLNYDSKTAEHPLTYFRIQALMKRHFVKTE